MTGEPFAAFTLDGIWKSYGSRAVLKGVTCTFRPGRIAAIVGPNGAGKTTLMRIAAGLQRPDAGAVPAERSLYYGGFDFLPRRGTVNALRRSLGLEDVDTGGRKLRVLSRGELQLAGLDIAMDLDPAVMFLDEPWTALEPDARDEFNARIREAASQRMIICSSHDLDEVARVADDVLFLANGVIEAKRASEGRALDREELLSAYRESKRS